MLGQRSDVMVELVTSAFHSVNSGSCTLSPFGEKPEEHSPIASPAVLYDSFSGQPLTFVSPWGGRAQQKSKGNMLGSFVIPVFTGIGDKERDEEQNQEEDEEQDEQNEKARTSTSNVLQRLRQRVRKDTRAFSSIGAVAHCLMW